MKKKMIKKLP